MFPSSATCPWFATIKCGWRGTPPCRNRPLWHWTVRILWNVFPLIGFIRIAWLCFAVSLILKSCFSSVFLNNVVVFPKASAVHPLRGLTSPASSQSSIEDDRTAADDDSSQLTKRLLSEHTRPQSTLPFDSFRRLWESRDDEGDNSRKFGDKTLLLPSNSTTTVSPDDNDLGRLDTSSSSLKEASDEGNRKDTETILATAPSTDSSLLALNTLPVKRSDLQSTTVNKAVVRDSDGMTPHGGQKKADTRSETFSWPSDESSSDDENNGTVVTTTTNGTISHQMTAIRRARATQKTVVPLVHEKMTTETLSSTQSRQHAAWMKRINGARTAPSKASTLASSWGDWRSQQVLRGSSNNNDDSQTARSRLRMGFAPLM